MQRLLWWSLLTLRRQQCTRQWKIPHKWIKHRLRLSLILPLFGKLFYFFPSWIGISCTFEQLTISSQLTPPSFLGLHMFPNCRGGLAMYWLIKRALGIANPHFLLVYDASALSCNWGPKWFWNKISYLWTSVYQLVHLQVGRLYVPQLKYFQTISVLQKTQSTGTTFLCLTQSVGILPEPDLQDLACHY